MTTQQKIIHWDLHQAQEIARTHLGDLGDRWRHVQAVGALAEVVQRTGKVSPGFAVAAWLHDIGYSEAIADTGFHPLDGARWLAARGAPRMVVGLVAHHTGAVFEAVERGLGAELGALPQPAQKDLNALTLVDLSTSPTGHPVTPPERIREILSRYPAEDPVHRAISAATPLLIRDSEAARRALALPQGWPKR